MNQNQDTWGRFLLATADWEQTRRALEAAPREPVDLQGFIRVMGTLPQVLSAAEQARLFFRTPQPGPKDEKYF